MKLLLWLSPLFSIGTKEEEVGLDDALLTMPRSERFPPHPPHGDMPVDPYAMAVQERKAHFYLYM